MHNSRPHRQLQRVLLADIAAGSLRPGERLPREQDIARQFGVSRALVREAIRGLEERRVVVVRQGHGTLLRAAEEWDVLDEDVLATMLGSEIGLEVLREFLESRRVIEVEAAGLAAERAASDDLEALANCLVRMGAAAERADHSSAAEDLFHEADVEFHERVVVAARNRVLAQMVKPIQRALLTARRPLARPEERLTHSLSEHKAILTAIARHDAAAARSAMLEHLATVERHLREHVTQMGEVAPT